MWSPRSAPPPCPAVCFSAHWWQPCAASSPASLDLCPALACQPAQRVARPALCMAQRLKTRARGHAQSTDTYSMGVLLWELHACRRAWAGLLPPQVIIKVGIQKARLPPLPGAPAEYQVRARRARPRPRLPADEARACGPARTLATAVCGCPASCVCVWCVSCGVAELLLRLRSDGMRCALQTLVDRCTDPDPWERPACAELAESLRSML